MEARPAPASRSAFPLRRRLRRAVLARRRLLAATTAAFAVLVGIQATAPAPPPTRTVVTAAHDLVGGAAITRSDLTLARFAPDTVPGRRGLHAGGSRRAYDDGPGAHR